MRLNENWTRNTCTIRLECSKHIKWANIVVGRRLNIVNKEMIIGCCWMLLATKCSLNILQSRCVHNKYRQYGRTVYANDIQTIVERMAFIFLFWAFRDGSLCACIPFCYCLTLWNVLSSRCRAVRNEKYIACCWNDDDGNGAISRFCIENRAHFSIAQNEWTWGNFGMWKSPRLSHHKQTGMSCLCCAKVLTETSLGFPPGGYVILGRIHTDTHKHTQTHIHTDTACIAFSNEKWNERNGHPLNTQHQPSS